MAPLSLCVICRDAASILPDCLSSAGGLTDDLIVVVDDRTVDDTAVVAASLGARVFIHRFTDFAAQKNFAASQALNDWALFLDADERLSPELAIEITQLNLQPTTDNQQPAAYSIPRINYLFGKLMHHTNWDSVTDSHVWLYDRRHAYWQGAVHEQVSVSGPVGRLVSPKVHLNYTSVESFISKLNHYTTFEAARRKFFFPLVFIYPCWKFVRHYIVFAGFLDGWHGLFLSYLQAIYGLSAMVKSWEVAQNSS